MGGKTTSRLMFLIAQLLMDFLLNKREHMEEIQSSTFQKEIFSNNAIEPEALGPELKPLRACYCLFNSSICHVLEYCGLYLQLPTTFSIRFPRALHRVYKIFLPCNGEKELWKPRQTRTRGLNNQQIY